VLVSAFVTNAGSNYKIIWRRNGIVFNTTSTSSVSFIADKGQTDTITATVIPQYLQCNDSSSSNAVIVKGNNVGLANMSGIGSVAVYPNPAHTTLTIDFRDKTAEADISLCNPLGVQALRQVATSRHTVLSLATVPPGVYFVRVNGVYMSTIVKE
jgi:Secretion system C-terminal sorting domain